MAALIAALAAGAVLGALATAAGVRRRGRQRDRELADARRRLEAARTARDTFFDLAAHELRSPLSAILGYQELLHDGAYGELPGDAHDAVERMGAAARHLLHLVDGIMELSRMRTGEVRLDLDTVDLGVVFSSTAEAFRSHTEDRGITPAVDLPPRLPTIRTDQDRLVRALDLLVTSAVRHPADGTMQLQVSLEDGGVTVAIGPTDMELDPAVDDPDARMGIRLAVAHRIGRLLGGGLELETAAGHARRILFHFRPNGPTA
ncbi:MAG: HAMP domain-containing sensor histidine kinase [Longimicrobiales bacterium]